MSDMLFERRDGGAYVTFNRPDVRNALTPDMLRAAADFVAEIADDPAVRYLVFAGAGAHFAAGGDLASYAQTLEQSARARRLYFERRVRGNAELFVRLEMLPIPVIAIVRGAAAGAGVSFILASDFVIAAEDATLIFAQPRVGLPLDLSVTYFLPRAIGEKKARQIAFTGASLKAAEAQALGIIDEIHPADGLEAALAGRIKSFRSVAPRAAGRSKQLINRSQDRSIGEQMEQEVAAIGLCVIEPDFAEGVTAFLDKRKAAFTGGDAQ
jgi:2-(1,2-epoxy-1,2-dihydrophenyl)acetyl-CoA isomerase